MPKSIHLRSKSILSLAAHWLAWPWTWGSHLMPRRTHGLSLRPDIRHGLTRGSHRSGSWGTHGFHWTTYVHSTHLLTESTRGTHWSWCTPRGSKRGTTRGSKRSTTGRPKITTWSRRSHIGLRSSRSHGPRGSHPPRRSHPRSSKPPRGSSHIILRRLHHPLTSSR